MRQPQIEKYNLFAYVNLDDHLSNGFTLPLFRKIGDHEYIYIQIVDDYNQTITEFRKIISDTNYKEFEFNYNSISVGNKQIFVFIRNSGEAIYGEIHEIENDLKSILETDELNSGIKLQIAHFVGSDEDKIKTRHAVYNNIAAKSGSESARLFRENSLAPFLFWERVSIAAKNEAAARRMHSHRYKVAFAFDKEGNLEIDTSAWDENDYSIIRINEIRRDIQGELNSLSIEGKAPNNDNAIETDNKNDNLYNNILRKISNSKRQEERVSLLLQAYSEDTEIGNRVIKTYKNDRSKFADSAISTIKEQLSSAPNNKIKHLIISKIISALFSKAFPYNRGFLLYYSAIHLGRNREIARTINHILGKTNSAHVLKFQNAIKDKLDHTGG